MPQKNGECYFLAEDGQLWLAESFVDENGVVTTTSRAVEP